MDTDVHYNGCLQLQRFRRQRRKPPDFGGTNSSGSTPQRNTTANATEEEAEVLQRTVQTGLAGVDFFFFFSGWSMGIGSRVCMRLEVRWEYSRRVFP